MPWELDAPSLDEAVQAVMRARRRAAAIREEIERGEYGRAAGHMLLGTPYSPDVDDPLAAGVNNESAEPRSTGGAKKPLEPTDERAAVDDIEATAAEYEADLDSRLADSLDEDHLRAAEQDRLGKPILKPDGSEFQHEEEVAAGVQGLRNRIEAAEKKLNHYQRFDSGAVEHALQRLRQFLDRSRARKAEIDRRFPNLTLKNRR